MLASGLTPIYPCHVSRTQMRTRPVGTGPFKLQSFSEFQSIRMVRNPDYWRKGRPYLDAIDFTIVNNPSTAALSFVAGRFDLTFPWEVTPVDLELVKKEAPAAICETTSMNLNVNLLVNRTAAPFDNPDMRRALVLALDRKAFVDGLTQGLSVVGGTMQPPPDGMWGLPAEMLAVVPGYGPDVENNRAEARALMEKMGYGADRPLRLKIAARGVALYKDAAEMMMGQLKAIHVDASLDVVETSLWFDRLRRKDYVLAVNATGNGRRSRPDLLRELRLQVGPQLHRLLQPRDRGPVRQAVGGKRSRQAPGDRARDRRPPAGRRRPSADQLEPVHDLPAALRQGLHQHGEQHLQRLPLRRRLAGQVGNLRPLSTL